MNKELQDILQEADIANFTKLLGLRWYAHAEKMNNKIMPNKYSLPQLIEEGKGENYWQDGLMRSKRI